MQKTRNKKSGSVIAAGSVLGGLIVFIICEIVMLLAAAMLISGEAAGEESAPLIITVSTLVASAAGATAICTKDNENKLRDLGIYCGVLILALLTGAVAGKTHIGENRTALITMCSIPAGAAAVKLVKSARKGRRRR